MFTVEAEKLDIGFPSKVVSPVPFGAMAIFPFAPSVIVIDPEVEFPVAKTKSKFPLDLRVPEALPLPTSTLPDPFGVNSISPLEPSTILILPVVEFPVANTKS